MMQIGTLAFFLHAIHWPLNQFVKLALAAIWPGNSDGILLVNYFSTILLTIAAAIFVARFLDAIAPKVFDHLSGGRSGVWSPARRPVLSQ